MNARKPTSRSAAATHPGHDRQVTSLIEAHIAHLRAIGRSEKTIEGRRRLLLALDRELPYGLHQVAEGDLIAWLGRREWAVQTRAKYLMHARGYYKWLVERDLLDFDPTARIAKPRVPIGVPHPCTDEQLADILTRADRPLLTCVILAAYAGMRCGEIARADRAELARDPIRILGKGGKERMVPRHPMIAEEVKQMRQPGRAVRGARGSTFRSGRLSRWAAEALDRLGYPDLTLHSFRHWFGTTTLAQCHDLRVVQELMGHSSPAVTAVYTLISSEQRRNAVAALPALTAAPC